MDVVDRLLRSGRAQHAYLGIQPAPLTPDIAHELGVDQTDGVVVLAVGPDGPAAAGLRPGDIIVNLGGTPTRRPRTCTRRCATTSLETSRHAHAARRSRADHHGRTRQPIILSASSAHDLRRLESPAQCEPDSGLPWRQARQSLHLPSGTGAARPCWLSAKSPHRDDDLGDDFTQGAANDFKSATEIARRMVSEFGMSSLGPRHIAARSSRSGRWPVTSTPRPPRCWTRTWPPARVLLTGRREVLAALVELLLIEETVDLAALRRLLDQRQAGPRRVAAVVEPTAAPAPELAKPRRAARRGRRPASIAAALTRSLATATVRRSATPCAARAAWRATLSNPPHGAGETRPPSYYRARK